jgi:hypothetical protein
MKLVVMPMIFIISNFIWLSVSVYELSPFKKNVNIKFQPPATFVLFWQKWFSEDLSAYSMSWSHADWSKFFIHPTRSNVSHFKMVETSGLQSWRLPTEFNKNLVFVSKVYRGDRHTDRNVIS